MTDPDARTYLWEKVRKNYFEHGVRIFWLDEAEPEYAAYRFDNYRYKGGTCLEIGNLYPLLYAKGFDDGMRSAGIESPRV